MLKVLLLKNGSLIDYLIGKVIELDEEFVILVEGCMRIVDGKLEEYLKYFF